MNLEIEYKIPKGFRKLRKNERVLAGDFWSNLGAQKWSAITIVEIGDINRYPNVRTEYGTIIRIKK